MNVEKMEELCSSINRQIGKFCLNAEFYQGNSDEEFKFLRPICDVLNQAKRKNQGIEATLKAVAHILKNKSGGIYERTNS
jgi:hypothetical protein